jgi:DnaD/phage-associated family protein
MTDFKGFPHGKFLRLPVPPSFFSDLLPLIDDLAELKLTLFCLNALAQREGNTPYLRWKHFINDEALMDSLFDEEGLQAALDKTCARGTLLCVEVLLESGREMLYFVNTPKGRTAVEQIRRGMWKPKASETDVEILPERPNVYTLYEQNIGMLTAHIADELKDAEQEFPSRWLEDAIKIAVESNKRNWRYVRGILLRWKNEGRHDESIQKSRLEDGTRYVTGQFSDIIKS